MAFAVAVQAGDAQPGPDKDKSACCGHKAKTSVSTQAVPAKDAEEGGCCASKMKMKTSTEAQGMCPFAHAMCGQQTAAKQTAPKQTALLSPKAASDATR